uniref:Nuclear receptor-binding factor 2 MIT domain-containing protein n=1 Tax=Sinocyclocheilus rhinocerous TaxID=307959 RepID=A0A673FRS3_9TELE
MEVMDSPLNRAHHFGRKADQLVAKEKFEEAILCHRKAAGKSVKPLLFS